MTTSTRVVVAVVALAGMIAVACDTGSTSRGNGSLANPGLPAASTSSEAQGGAASVGTSVTGSGSTGLPGTTALRGSNGTRPRVVTTITHPSAGCAHPSALLPLNDTWRVALSPGGSGPLGPGRTYLLGAGPGARPDAAKGVVVLLHGRSSNGPTIANYTELATAADQLGALLVLPEAIGENRQWAAADTAYLDAVLDDLQRTHCIDEDRVWVAGLSMGGFMAARYACDRGTRIAAIATVAGLGFGGATCTSAPAVPVLSFHGTADQVIPYQGRPPAFEDVIPSTGAPADTVAWAAHNRCAPTPIQTKVSAEVTRRQWSGCAAETVAYEIVGGGHSWPGAEPDVRQGHTTSDISATRTIEDFFGRNQRRFL